jgi:hypothetical protein
MNTLARRVRKLETKLVPPVDLRVMRLAELLRARRRRSLAAEGRFPVEEDQLPDQHRDADLPQALVEVLQRGRFRRSAEDIRGTGR